MQKETNPRGIAALPMLATVLVLAIIVVGTIYFAGRDQVNTNTDRANGNVNTTTNLNAVAANENSKTALNANAVANVNGAPTTNQSANSNVAQNTNATVNTNTGVPAGWQTYLNTQYGYSFDYPVAWSHSYVYQADANPVGAYDTPLHYSDLRSPDGSIQLILGVDRVGDRGTTYYRTGIGAGDIRAGEVLTIDGVNVNTWQRVFEGRVVEVFLFPVASGATPVVVSGHEVLASVSIVNSDTDRRDLVSTATYQDVIATLQSLRFQ